MLLSFLFCALLIGCATTKTMEQWIENNSVLEPYSAVFIAKDADGRWAGGASWNYGTEVKARSMALGYCEKSRIKKKINNPCKLYSLNNRVMDGGGQATPQIADAVSFGTGFAVTGDGLLMTAYHVIKNAKAVSIRLADGVKKEAKIVNVSETLDLAVLKIDSHTPNYLSIKSSQTIIAAGDKVFTFGFPVVKVLGNEPKYTDGAISSLSGIGGDVTFLQITVPVQPGNSGGPLISEKGEVVGIITASAAIVPFMKVSGTLPQNVNWAVNASFTAPLLPKEVFVKKVQIERGKIIENARKAVFLIEAIK